MMEEHAEHNDALEGAQGGLFEEVHLRDYLWVVRKRLAFVIVSIIACLAIGIASSWNKVPRYTATAQMLAGSGYPTSPLISEKMVHEWVSKQDVSTYCELITSPNVAASVVQKLGIQSVEDMGFSKRESGGTFLAKAMAWVRSKVHANNADAPRPTGMTPEMLANLLRGSIQVKSSERIIYISYTCENPETAARIANGIAQCFIDNEFERRMARSRKFLAFLRREQREFEKNVRKAEQEIVDYQNNLDAIVIGVDEKARSNDALARKVDTLTSALAAASVDRIKKESAYRNILDSQKAGKSLTSIPEIINDPAFAKLEDRTLEIENQITDALVRYGPKHPQVVSLRNSLQLREKKRERLAERIAAQIENAYKRAVAEERNFGEVLKKAREEMRKANQNIVEYNMKVRIAEMNKQMFDVILKKSTEVSLVQDVQSINLNIASPAQSDIVSTSSKKGRTIFLSLFLGVCLGVGLAFFVDYMDNSIRDPKDIETYLQCNLLGILDNVEAEGAGRILLPTIAEPRSNISEHFRVLRTNLLFSPAVNESKQVVVTSANPKEGKSTVSMNLATVMAQAGRRVLLVEADMRRPVFHRALELSKDVGLSTVLIGDQTLEDAVQKTHVPGLHVLCAGPIPPNQTELLGSDTFAQFVKEARQKYDILIFDTPPMSVIDPVLVATMGGGAVFLVVRSGKTKRYNVRRMLKQLRQFNIPMVGVLLNRVNVRRKGYYQYYYSYYGYYGYHEDEETEKPAPAAPK